MIYPASHPPPCCSHQEEQWIFILSLLHLSLVAALFTKSFLKTQPSFIPYPRGSWFHSHAGKHSPLLVFSKHCSSCAFLLVCSLIRWDIGSMFLFGALLASVLHHLILWCHVEKRVCTGMWYPDLSWGRGMPAGYSGTPGCFLQYGICAGAHTPEMFI